ncbi:MAG: glycoside hydrolase family 3 C-terminal domain-containing protein, partial [Bryobacteraceae bacterium]
GRYSQEGRYLMRELQHLAPTLKTHLLDPAMPPEELDRAKQEAAGCSVDVVAAFVTVAAYRGNVALPGHFPDFVNALTAAKAPVILVSLGNPYLVRNFPKVAAYLATFSTTSTSEIAAAKALMGIIPIGGKLPVTIPGIAKYGDGLSIPAAPKGPTQ